MLPKLWSSSSQVSTASIAVLITFEDHQQIKKNHNIATREKRKVVLKEDVKYPLEELWEAEEWEKCYKIFTRKTSKETHEVMRYSKEELHEISYAEEDGSMHYLKKHKVGDVRMLVH